MKYFFFFKYIRLCATSLHPMTTRNKTQCSRLISLNLAMIFNVDGGGGEMCEQITQIRSIFLVYSISFSITSTRKREEF